MKKEYTNGEVTVTWQPDVCIHSKKCWTELFAVFNPSARPWINIQGAVTEEIINQVKKCPSGALGYYLNNQDQTPEEKPKYTSFIEVTKSGPLLVHGKITVKHHDDVICEKDNITAFCRCGASSNKPFCDGSHRKVEFE